ncbi:MAG: Ger(x)C family spore germination protein [Clostridia bacterium]|nr:Ger(x)C family spore germination protein [Clostridia bacterium]
MSKRIAAFFLVALTLILSGCTSKEDQLKDMALAQGLGIDYKDEKYSVSFMAYDLSKTRGSNSELSGTLTKVFKSIGESVPYAITDITTLMGKKPYYSHNRIVIIGEDMAQEGLQTVFDFLYRNAEMRPYVLVAVARGDAQEILGANLGEVLNPAEEIQNVITVGAYYSYVPEIEIIDIAISTLEKTSDSYLPIVEIVKDGEEEVVKASGTAIFNNMKLVGELGEQETKGLLWMNDAVQYGTLVCTTSMHNMVSSEIIEGNTDVEVRVENGKIKYDVLVTCMLNVDQVDGKESNSLSREQMREIEVKYVDVIKGQIDSALKKCLVQYGSDVFRLGKRLWQEYPDVYREVSENWRERLAELEFEIEVKVQVSKTGEEGIDIND